MISSDYQPTALIQSKKLSRPRKTIRHDIVIKGLIVASVMSTLIGFHVMLSFNNENHRNAEYAIHTEALISSHQVTHVNVDGWKIWDKTSILSSVDESIRCKWVQYKTRLRVSGKNKIARTTPICLPHEKNHDRNDGIVNEIISKGVSSKCSDTVKLFGDRHHHSTKNKESISPLIFIEVGANIGDCVIHVLLATEAKIIIFEPNARNLFYMTSSLLVLDETLRSRVTLFPIALGQTSRTYQFVPTNNRGNNTTFTQNDLSEEKSLPNVVYVEPLDAILRNSSRISLLRISTGGSECEVLRGMHGLMNSVDTIQFELSPKKQLGNNCTNSILFNMLKDSHFLYTSKGTKIESLTTSKKTKQKKMFVARLKQ